MRKPDFFIVGAAKAGTTSLWQYLSQHSEIFMPEGFTNKEPDYYCNNKGINNEEDYVNLFKSASPDKTVGEASTAYLTAPESAVMIKKDVPGAKIIITLRNPAVRAFSLYKWMARHGFESENTFEKALIAEAWRLNNPVFQKENPALYYNYLYFNSGLYSEQVKRYLDIFGKDNCLIIVFEEFMKSPKEQFKALCRFLSIDDKVVPDFKIYNKAKFPLSVGFQYFCRNTLPSYLSKFGFRYNKQSFFVNLLIGINNRLSSDPKIDKNLYADLMKRFKEDISKTSVILDKDLHEIWGK